MRTPAAAVVAGALALATLAPATSAMATDPGAMAAAPAATATATADPIYTGVAIVLQLKGGPAYFCLGGVLLSLPPAGCGGVVLRGIDARTLPGAHVYPGGTVDTGLLRVVGSWDGRELTPTSPIVKAEPAKQPPYVALRAACDRPGGTTRPDADGEQRAEAAADRAPDLSYLYVSGHHGRVLNAAFTGDLARHRAALRKLYSGPICVFRGRRTARTLNAVSNRIGHDLALLGHHGIVVLEWGPRLDRMSMTVVVADPAVRRFIHRRYGSFVEVHGVLRRVG